MNNKWITLKNFIRQNWVVDIALDHYFEVTLNRQSIVISYNWKLNNWITLITFSGNQTNLE